MGNRTYLDLINDVLVELYYEQSNDFEELSGLTEGIKVKKMLNDALRTICNNEATKWQFREVDKVIALAGGIKDYDMPNGFIRYIRYLHPPIVLNYLEDHDDLPLHTMGLPTNYWIENDKINFFPVPSMSENGKLVKIEYNTYDFAKDQCGVYKPVMELATDEPIIPDHHRDVLVWKVCADWRANISDTKASFYQAKYKTAYKALLSDQRMSKDYPNKLDVMPSRKSFTDGMIQAFNNIYTKRIR